MCTCAKSLNSFSFWGSSGGLRPQTPCRGSTPGPHWVTSVPKSLDWPVFTLGLSGESPKNKFQNPPPKKKSTTEEPKARIHSWMTLTKILVPICRYCLNCKKFGQLILRKIIKIVATMHQIRFWLGLCPRPRWGSLQRSPDPVAGFKRAYF